MVEKNKGFQIFANVVMILLMVCCLAPFVLLFMSSITDEQALIANGYSFFPEEFSLEAYKYILADSTQMVTSYILSFVVTIIGTVCNLTLTTLFAYPLSRKDLPGRKFVNFYLFFTMLFSGGLVPSYIMWTRTFHIQNTIWALIVPNLMMSAFNVFILLLALAILLFGGTKLAGLGKAMGRSIREFKEEIHADSAEEVRVSDGSKQ